MFPRKNIQTLTPYSAARDLYTSGIFLDANELPAAWVTVDYTQAPPLSRYPDSQCRELREKLCDIYLPTIRPDQVIMGNGSDEIIDLLLRAYVPEGGSIMVTDPSYSVYGIQAEIAGVNVVSVPLCPDFSLDIDQMCAKVKNVQLIYVCSPGNPTGLTIGVSQITELLKSFTGLVIVDEAYIEFAGMQKSAMTLLQTYDNLVVLRTFSKAWGLASIRVGYAIANTSVIDTLMKIKPAYNVSALSQYIARTALEQSDKLMKQIEYILQCKEDLVADLTRLTITTISTETNFILMKIKDASRIYEQLAAAGIIVRDRSRYLKDTLRITVGTREENKRLVNILQTLI